MSIVQKSDLEKLQLANENFISPFETASAPEMTSRRAGATFTTAANNENLVLDGRTYTFKTTLTAPAAGNVYVKVQGTVAATIAKLAEAIRGVVDADNIAYATGESVNPTCTAFFTSKQFAVGSTIIAAGNNLFILEKAEDTITAITFTTTATGTLTAFTRAGHARYVLNGNATPATDSIRGNMQCILPMGSIVIGGQSAPLGWATYACHRLAMIDQSATSKKEIDIYYSLDEVTFVRVARGITIAHNLTASKLYVGVELKMHRIPKGAGMYIKCGSDGTDPSENFDMKFAYHLYPSYILE